MNIPGRPQAPEVRAVWWVLAGPVLALPALGIPEFTPPSCSVIALRENPEGYFWPLDSIRGFVRDAELVVRAVVTGTDDSVDQEFFLPIRFRVIELLRGAAPDVPLVLPGFLVEEDDFNTGTVPYRMVRASGQRGNCFAHGYRIGAEYLLLLRRVARLDNQLSVHWAALAPTNEQLRGPADPWLAWVRTELVRR